MSALFLLSGGLDSTVAATLYARDVGSMSLGLFVDYGQRALEPERRAVRAIGEVLGVEVIETQVQLLKEVTETALVNERAPLPRPSKENLDCRGEETADAGWVPNRNGILVNLAAALAEARGLDTVVVGFNREEGATFPDNTADYVERLNASLDLSTRGAVHVECPTLGMTKAELLREGRVAGAPVDLTWSCYEGGESACLTCESCCRRIRAEEDQQGDDF